MSLLPAPARTTPARRASVDNLKVLLVVGVIVGHATIAWTDQGGWVFREPPVREPLLTLLSLVSLVAVLFAMPLFLLLAGTFTPGSLARKGLRRFLMDRLVRLGVPLVCYLLLIAPLVEYADVVDAGDWHRGFPAFVIFSWLHPAPGPLWFLEVLLLFSVGYGVLRTLIPRRTTAPQPMRARQLVAAGAFVATAAYAIRIAVPFGKEFEHVLGAQDLYLALAPAWITGFTLGVIGAERDWFTRMSPAMSRGLFRVAWGAAAGVVVLVSVTVGALGGDIEDFFGGGSWQSLLLAVLEGALVVAMSLWLVDVFRRRVDHQGRLGREMSRAAFAAFLVHQIVLVGAVLATRQVGWPPELEYLAAGALAVVASFGIGALLVRLPGVSRVV